MPKMKKELKNKDEEIVKINPMLKDIEPEIIEFNEKKSKFKLYNHSHEFKTIEVIFVTLITLIIGFCIGYLVLSVNNSKKSNINTTDSGEFNKIIKTYNYITKQYINEIDKDELINGAIEGMLNKTGDPYTSYYDEKETTTFYKELKGTFYGIGCAILKNENDNYIYVVDVLENSPAEKNGVLKNDIIIEVNNETTDGLTSMEVVNLIEKSKKEVSLKIIRNKENKLISMNKENVVIKSIKSSIFEKNDQKIGYIKIKLFALNSYEQFKEELNKLEKKNIDSLIIDVRDNEGGYLTTVSNIVSLFFNKNTVIYQLQTKTDIIKKYSLSNEKRDYEVVVLQNNGSASGSEILSSVFKEQKDSEIIGTNSYGKSSVQQTIDLGDGTMFKYTTKKWLTSLGNNIGGFGVEATIKVEQNKNYYINQTNENDAQLQKALLFLSE